MPSNRRTNVTPNPEYVAQLKADHAQFVKGYNARYRAENLEHLKASARAWRERNIDQVKLVSARYREENKEAVSQRKASYKRLNPHKVNYASAKRRAISLLATPLWASIKAMDAIYRQAQILTSTLGVQMHVDHIVPLNSPLVCGLHVEHNLSVVTARENLSKNNHSWPDMP